MVTLKLCRRVEAAAAAATLNEFRGSERLFGDGDGGHVLRVLLLLLLIFA